MTEIQTLLAQALTELPGGPIVPPVGLGVKGERRRVLRRRGQALGAVVAAVAVAGGAVLVGLGGSSGTRTTPAVGGSPSLCPGGPPDLVAAGPGTIARSTAEQARSVLYRMHGLYQRGYAAPPVLAVEKGQVLWGIDVLSAPGKGGLLHSLWLLPDGTLSPLRIATCSLPIRLEGATVENSPVPVVPSTAAAAPPVVDPAPVEPLTREQASLRWLAAGMRNQDRALDLTYNPGCNGSARVQVEQAPTYVLVQVVRNGPESGALCVSIGRAEIALDEPLGGRLLLHAATREILPTKAYERDPAYLPDGATPVSDTTDHSLRTRVWSLLDGRRLTIYVGIRSVFDDPPSEVPFASYVARFGGVNGAPDLAWEEGGVPVQVRLSPAQGRKVMSPLEILQEVAESLYTPEYVSLTEAAATDLALSYGLKVRVAHPGSCCGSYSGNPSRVTFTIVDGHVTSATFG